MKSSSEFTGVEVRSIKKKWYQNSKIWIVIAIVLLLLAMIILTTVLLVKKMSEKNNATHIHYTRISTTVHPGGFEMYRLKVLSKRNPTQQYQLLADFLRLSLFNKSTYEQHLPNCPIILAMTATDHPEDWHAMLFATLKFPRANMPYPYICFLSVLPKDRSYRLGSILLNQFLNDMMKERKPVTHVQLHTNWENCRAQALYRRCGFRCNEFTPNGYKPPFEPQYQFGHMVRMELDMGNIRQRSHLCFNASGVEISPEKENTYTQLCNKNKPSTLNETCHQTKP